MKKITKKEFIEILCTNKSVFLGVYTTSIDVDTMYNYVLKNDLSKFIRVSKARSRDVEATILADGSKSYLDFQKDNEFFLLEKANKKFLALHKSWDWEGNQYNKFLYYYITY